MFGSLFLVFVSVLPYAIVGFDFDPDEPLESDEMIDAINSANTSWKAGRNFDSSFTKAYLPNLFGLRRTPGEVELPALEDDDDDDLKLPETFDAREKWGYCRSLQEIRDQGSCGSCWAVSTASAFTDRLCIASRGKFNGHLSSENLLSCSEGDGCQGGIEFEAWNYIKNTGIVTGGDYGSNEGCQPYQFPPCEHHTIGPRKNCTDPKYQPTPECQLKCLNTNYTTSYHQDLHKVKTVFSISNNNKLLQKEIFKNGPVVAGFDVYCDFLSYRTGVYYHKNDTPCGGHAVKVIGWGTENDMPYWLAANSWNTDWGDEGFFKIKRGDNESGFEDEISGGYPIV